MPKEIKEKIIERIHKIFFKWHLHLPDIEIEIADQILGLFSQEKQKWAEEILPEIQRIMIDNMLGWKSTTKVSTREWKKMIKEIEQKLKKVGQK